MSIDWETGALIGCFGTFGTPFIGSETTIGTGAAVKLTDVDTSRSLSTPTVDEDVVGIESCSSPEDEGDKEKIPYRCLQD